jgi:hypothetical protein
MGYCIGGVCFSLGRHILVVMRTLFSLLLGLVLFFPAAYSQDTTVCITPGAARYFLEANDERWVLREKDTLQTILIGNLREQVLVKDQIIETYKSDSTEYQIREATFLAQLRLKDKELDDSKRKLRLRKSLEVLGAIGIIVALILL